MEKRAEKDSFSVKNPQFFNFVFWIKFLPEEELTPESSLSLVLFSSSISNGRKTSVMHIFTNSILSN